MDDLRIEELGPNHKRSVFTCGVPALDTFFRDDSLRHQSVGVSKTYVLAQSSDGLVVGFYSSSASVIKTKTLPDEKQIGLPAYPMPAVHLGKLAVDINHQGKGHGKTLLFEFLDTVADVSEIIGIYGADVFAKNDGVKSFYLKYQFMVLKDNPKHLLLPIAFIREMSDKQR